MRKIAIILLIALLLPGCTRAPERFSEIYFDYFDTVITLTGYAADRTTFERAAHVARSEFERLHAIFDIYEPHEGVLGAHYLNNSGGEAVKIDDDLMKLLLFSKAHYEDAQGRVNIAMGAVLSLWKGARDKKVLPDAKALTSANRHSAIENIALDPEARTAQLLDPSARIDLGSVAKGYAVERVAEKIQDIMPMFLIDAGGNIRAGDPPPGKEAYTIGIADPFNTEGIVMTIPLARASAVTSGGYQRVAVIDGIEYHHLIDPDTLMPGQFMKQVTIITEDSALADYLSTAAFLLPYEASRALTERLCVSAIWVLNDGTIEQSGAY